MLENPNISVDHIKDVFSDFNSEFKMKTDNTNKVAKPKVEDKVEEESILSKFFGFFFNSDKKIRI